MPAFLRRSRRRTRVAARTARRGRHSGQRGQSLILFVMVFTVVALMVGVVIDGGYGLSERRTAQNAADFGALDGARIIAEKISGDTVNGTDANVETAITTAVQDNGGAAVTFGSPDGPIYVDTNGSAVGFVGAGSIPATAVGVKVTASRTWKPFFLGIVGVSSWTASADATARGGYAAGPPGPVFPAGIAEAFFNGRQTCSGGISSTPGNPCYPAHLTPGSLNVPGGFGWLKFGCSGDGLGQGGSGGCSNAKTFLQTEIGPPGRSFGCCTQTGLPGSADKIGSLPGDKTSADCSYYIDNHVVVNIAVWDTAGGTGSGSWYHIVGFTGFQITGCDGGKDLEGVWRQPFSFGPTTTTPGFAGQALAVELVH
jgi:Flp pilus assembly protein TadG